mgnify:CR=1 FL=1
MAPRQKEGGNFIKNWTLTVILAVVLAILSVLSLFVGVIDIQLAALLAGDLEQLEIFLISRLPRLLAILCTGVGMSVAGLIMQQLCMNKFVSPTTGATISSAQFGILLALLFMPGSTLMGRAFSHSFSRSWEPGSSSGSSSTSALRTW